MANVFWDSDFAEGLWKDFDDSNSVSVWIKQWSGGSSSSSYIDSVGRPAKRTCGVDSGQTAGLYSGLYSICCCLQRMVSCCKGQENTMSGLV